MGKSLVHDLLISMVPGFQTCASSRYPFEEETRLYVARKPLQPLEVHFQLDVPGNPISLGGGMRVKREEDVYLVSGLHIR